MCYLQKSGIATYRLVSPVGKKFLLDYYAPGSAPADEVTIELRPCLRNSSVRESPGRHETGLFGWTRYSAAPEE
jgi:hypothetical protein